MPITLTTSTFKQGVPGDERVHSGTINLGAYATGGIAFTPGTFKLAKLRHLQVSNGVVGGAPRVVTVDIANSKIQAWVPNTGAEVANLTDLSTMLLNFTARGSI